MSWLGNIFSGSQSSSTSVSTTSTTTGGGTFAGVGQTTPSTLPYTTPTYHTVSTTGVPTGGASYIPSGTPTGIYNPNQTYTISSGGLSNYGTIHIQGQNPTIATDKVKIDLNELGELINVLKERFLIITPNFEKHEKYAALKKAYDHYKLLEAMLSGDENGNR